MLIFQRLAKHLQDMFFIFGEFVQKKDAVVGQADFAGSGQTAVSDESDVGCRVMRRAERAAPHKTTMPHTYASNFHLNVTDWGSISFRTCG